MLRECARYEALAKILLYSEDFYNFFKYVEVSTFDIASDAFSTFKASFSPRDFTHFTYLNGYHYHNLFSGVVNQTQDPLRRIPRGQLRQGVCPLSGSFEFRELRHSPSEFETSWRTSPRSSQLYRKLGYYILSPK